jgi:hypothetical protein
MTDIDFNEKFIGFVDILGFKNLVEAAENRTGMPLSSLLENGTTRMNLLIEDLLSLSKISK